MPQKYILPPSVKRYSPLDEHALYKGNFATGNGATELKNDCACVTFDPVGGHSAGVGGKISTQAANS